MADKRMTVRELIDALQQLDPNSPLFVAGYEGGFQDVEELIPICVELDVNPSLSGCCGPHEHVCCDEPCSGGSVVKGYYIYGVGHQDFS